MAHLRVAGLLGMLLLATPLSAAFAEQPKPVAPVGEHQRVLPLQGGQNFRDLGGYKTTSGRTVRWRVLYRSGSMHFLTPADYAFLEGLGIRTVCDFRDNLERKREPVTWPKSKARWLTMAEWRKLGLFPASGGHQPPSKRAQLLPNFTRSCW
ncbi:tyrosine-protein phosphatase [Sphingomonas sp. 32-62-10]|uniref:tyrosine-protein phosphatase n=1 Tax=Sphingomonas sp. 32-62-10 TaxID=1970436 RepID=UPI0035A975F5